MDTFRRIFSFEAASLRPRLACEITPAGVVAARPNPGSEEVLSAFVPLRPAIFHPGLRVPVFSDRKAIVSALRQALDEVHVRDTKITLVIPDASVRVLLLDFDSLPAKTAEALPILRFRLRKLVPFEVEGAAVSYQILSSKNDLVRTIVAVVPAEILAEYEGVVREAGYEPGAVLPSTIAALAAVQDGEPSLVVNRNGDSVTTAITQQHELLLHRTLELSSHQIPGDEPALGNPGQADNRHYEQELHRTVSVAIAYFEDTLAAPPRRMLACGLGGAEELARLLGDIAIPAFDLVPAPATGNTTAMPRGVLAGVVGALAS